MKILFKSIENNDNSRIIVRNIKFTYFTYQKQILFVLVYDANSYFTRKNEGFFFIYISHHKFYLQTSKLTKWISVKTVKTNVTSFHKQRQKIIFRFRLAGKCRTEWMTGNKGEDESFCGDVICLKKQFNVLWKCVNKM